MAPRPLARHRVAATLFGLLVLVIPGALALFFALFYRFLPGPWGAARVGDGSVAAAVVQQSAGGFGLLVLAWGLSSFSRWAWYGYIGWATVTVYRLSQTMFAGEALITFEGLSVLVPLALPYLWRVRHSFGIGSESPRARET